MYILFGLLFLMLLIALGLIAIPFLRIHKLQSTLFLTTSFFIVALSIILYGFSGDKAGLSYWITQGAAHYQLQVQVNELGGIDGIIERIKAKLAKNPNDAQGWLILGKLYHDKHDDKKAKEAFEKANALVH